MVDTNLGITVDSKQIATAAVDLDRLAQAAIEAGSAVTRLATQTTASSTATQSMAAANTAASASAQATVAALNTLTAAQTRSAAAAQQAGAAAVGQTEAMHGLRFSVANVAAQFQDIAVTSAMGMNPFTIALQQGTQLSAVLGASGGGLTGVLRLLGTALGSVLSPLSLVTIGLVAAGSAAIQFGIQSFQGAEEASKALEEHSKWLEEILEGYDAAGKAAKEAADEAQQLPRATVESNLTQDIEDQTKKLQEFQKTIDDVTETLIYNRDLARGLFERDPEGSVMGDVADQIDSLVQLGLSAKSTASELDAASDAATKLKNSTDSDSIRDMAQRVLDLIAQLRAMNGVVQQSTDAIYALNNAAALSNFDTMSDAYTKAFGKLESSVKGLRTERERAKDDLKDAQKNATTDLMRFNAQQKYDELIAGYDKRDAARAAASAAKKESPTEKWMKDTADYERRLDLMQVENDLWDKNTFEKEKATATQDLLNQAQKDGLDITPEVTDQIDQLATRYAELKLQAEGVQTTLENRTVFEKLMDDLKELDAQLAAGAISWETYARAAGGATAGAAEQALGAISGLVQGLSNAFEDNKALSVATAVLKGAEAVASAYAAGNQIGGPVIGAAFAAVAAITAAANVAAVLAVDKNSTSMTTSGSGGSTPVTPTAQYGTGLNVQLIGSASTPTTLGNVEGMLREIQSYLGTQGKQLAITYKGQ